MKSLDTLLTTLIEGAIDIYDDWAIDIVPEHEGPAHLHVEWLSMGIQIIVSDSLVMVGATELTGTDAERVAIAIYTLANNKLRKFVHARFEAGKKQKPQKGTESSENIVNLKFKDKPN